MSFQAEKHPMAEMVQKMGKDAFVRMASQRNTNEKTGAEKDRGIKGRIKFKMCSHRVWVIENYEAKPCAECMGVPRGTKSKDFKPYFNQGLGAFVSSRSDEKRIAKQMGLTEAG